MFRKIEWRAEGRSEPEGSSVMFRYRWSVFSSPDTDGEAAQVRLRHLQSLTGSARALLAAELTDEANDICRSGIAARHPLYSAGEVQLAFVRLRLGDELFRVALPDAPLLAP